MVCTVTKSSPLKAEVIAELIPAMLELIACIFEMTPDVPDHLMDVSLEPLIYTLLTK